MFNGLDARLPACLRELEQNNSREWFHAHRQEYQDRVATPLASLAELLAPGMARLDGSLVKKMSRPQRDARFVSNKPPYRTEAWFAFRRTLPNWTEYPAFFFEAAPEHCRWGMGYYSARPATMAALRDIAQENHKRFGQAMAMAASRGFTLQGELYKRPPGIPADTPEAIVDLMRRRNAYLCRIMDYGPLLLSDRLADTLAADFAALGGMYRLFCMANERHAPALPF